MQFTDSHAHLADDKVFPDVEGVVTRAGEAGVTTIVSVATGADDARTCIQLAERFTGVYATAGIHPHRAAEYDEDAIRDVRLLLDDARVVAVGETGLDYHYDFSPRDVQRLRSKLADQADWIETVRGFGYRFRTDPPQ